MLGWQRNLSFFAVHVSLPCLVHPALLENPKRPRFAWRFFGTRKAPRSPERLWCSLVGYEIKRLLLDDNVLSFAEQRSFPLWRTGSDRRFVLNSVVVRTHDCIWAKWQNICSYHLALFFCFSVHLRLYLSTIVNIMHSNISIPTIVKAMRDCSVNW